MGLFNKILNRSDKSAKKQDRIQPKAKKDSDTKEEEELSIAELKEKKDNFSKGEVKKVAKKSVKNEDTKNAYKILVKPMVTEKGTYLASQNKYIFEVTTRANKVEIKKAIKAVYGVEPIKVNIVTISGRKVRYGKTRGKTKDRKKAVVTLAQGQVLEVYEGV